MPLPDELADAGPGKIKVLLVGEPGPEREGAARQLALGDYAVEAASPGFAAGAAAARYEPDAVVLIAAEPDGGEVLRGLSADRELRGVAVVGLGPAEWREPLLKAGCAEVLDRSPEEGLLAVAIRRAVAVSGDVRPVPSPPADERDPAAGEAGGMKRP
jgi:CheY-like chemotaxis protein